MEEKKYLKWYNKVGYGSGDIAGNVVFAFLSSFIMIYLTNTVGLNAGVIGSLIAASKVLDGISDVVFGSMIDRTHTKMGRHLQNINDYSITPMSVYAQVDPNSNIENTISQTKSAENLPTPVLQEKEIEVSNGTGYSLNNIQGAETVKALEQGKLTVIAHVACNNTKDSQELARHAESLGVDAIAAIPPIYFHLPEYAIAQYWNDISAAAPNTDFVIYNIPQLAGVALTQGLFAEMRKNPNVIGVKNSSMPVQDIQMFKQAAGPDYIIFNGPDEQFMSGRVIGAEGAIGGTYGVMPELYLKLDEYVIL